MNGELEFTEYELSAFETPADFKKYLLELDKEYELNDVDELMYYFQKKALDFSVYVDILKKFKHDKGI